MSRSTEPLTLIFEYIAPTEDEDHEVLGPSVLPECAEEGEHSGRLCEGCWAENSITETEGAESFVEALFKDGEGWPSVDGHFEVQGRMCSYGTPWSVWDDYEEEFEVDSFKFVPQE